VRVRFCLSGGEGQQKVTLRRQASHLPRDFPSAEVLKLMSAKSRGARQSEELVAGVRKPASRAGVSSLPQNGECAALVADLPTQGAAEYGVRSRRTWIRPTKAERTSAENCGERRERPRSSWPLGSRALCGSEEQTCTACPSFEPSLRLS